MSRRRYEILLPTRYNDTTPVEPEKFFETQEELVARFGGLTTSPELLRGVWIQSGQRFEDQHIRLPIDVEGSAENRAFFEESLLNHSDKASGLRLKSWAEWS